MRILEETNRHFMLQAPNGARIRVAKTGLSQATAAKIKGYEKGGKVQYGTSPENTLNPEAVDAFKKGFSGEAQPKPEPKPQPKKVAQYEKGTGPGGVQLSDAETQMAGQPKIEINVGHAPQATSTQDPQQLMQVLEAAYQTGQQSAAQNASMPMPGMPQGGEQAAAQNVSMPMPGMPQERSVASQKPFPDNLVSDFLQNNPIPPISTEQNPIQKIAQDERTPTPTQSKALKDMFASQNAISTELGAQNKKLDTAQGALEKTLPTDKIASQLADYEAIDKKIRSQMGSIRDEVANFEFKPGTLFSPNGVSLNNIATALSVLAGGVSQGLTGSQTNPVMDFIHKQIERDVENQKLQFGKLRNRYTMLREEGMDNREATNRLVAEQLHAVSGMMQINEQKTKNLALKSQMQTQRTMLDLQGEAATKQLTNDELGKKYLQGIAGEGAPQGNLTGQQGTQGGSTQAGVLPVSATTGPTASKSSISEKPMGSNPKAFEEIAPFLPRFAKNAGLEKEIPEAIKEVQRLKDAHEAIPKILSLYKQAIQHRGDARNLVRQGAAISGIIQHSFPFIKQKEGAPRHFEAEALKDLLPKYWDKPEDIPVKDKAFFDFLMNGATSSLLDAMRIPYPKLKLGGERK